MTAAWVAALLLLGAGSLRLRFEGDLSSLSLTTPGIAAAERSLAEVWGQTGSRALLAVEGGSLEEALAANDRLFASIADRLPRGSLVSLAPLCPSLATQEANRLRWSRFWDGGRREALRAALAREGDALGFAPRAFDGFLASLASPPGAPVTLEGLRRAGLGDLVSLLVREGEGGKVTVFTLLPDTPETAALLGGPGSPLPGGVRFASASLFRATVAKALTRDFTRFLAGALLAMVLLLLLLYRDLRRPLLALVPVLTGLLFMFGAMAALGIPFNLYNVVASVLVIGLAVDYGIFMVDKLEGTADHDTDRAILLNGLTSLAGFGSLVLASHPALHSIGLSVLLGVGAAFPAALLVVPALGARGGEARG